MNLNPFHHARHSDDEKDEDEKDENNYTASYTAIDILDCVSSIPKKEMTDEGWILDNDTQVIIPHHLMIRILDFAILPQAVVALGFLEDSKESTKLNKFRGYLNLDLLSSRHFVYDIIKSSKIIKKKIPVITEENINEWKLGPVQAFHKPLGSYQTALKYQVCKSYATAYLTGSTQLHKHTSSYLKKRFKETLKPFKNPSAALFCETVQQSINVLHYIKLEMVQSTYHTRLFYKNKKESFTSRNPLDNEFQSYPIHDFQTCSMVRLVNKRLERLVEKKYCSLQEELNYKDFKKVLEMEGTKYDDKLRDCEYSEDLLEIEESLFKPNHNANTKSILHTRNWSQRQLNKGYRPFCCCTRNVYHISNLSFLGGSFLTIALMIMLAHAINVYTESMRLLSSVSNFNETNLTTTIMQENITTPTFTKLKEFNILEEKLTTSTILLGSFPLFILIFLLFRCHFPLLIFCCHGNIGCDECCRLNSRNKEPNHVSHSRSLSQNALFCCGRCLFLDFYEIFKLSYTSKDHETGKIEKRNVIPIWMERHQSKRSYHHNCQHIGMMFIVFWTPILLVLIGILQWTKSVINMNKEHLSAIHVGNRTTVNDVIMIDYSANPNLLWYSLPFLVALLMLFLISGIACIEAIEKPAGDRDKTVMLLCLCNVGAILISLTYLVICFIINVTNGITDGSAMNATVNFTSSSFLNNMTSTTEEPKFQMQWIYVVLPFAFVIVIIFISIPCQFKIVDPITFRFESKLTICGRTIFILLCFFILMLLPANIFVTAAVMADSQTKNGIYNESIASLISTIFYIIKDWETIAQYLMVNMVLVLTPVTIMFTITGFESKIY